LVKVWKDTTKKDADMRKLHGEVERLSREVKELEDEADDLKEDMEGQYVGGFRSVIEQVQVLFPDIDGDVLAQADFLKKIQDGKLVSRLPA
jgi:phage host-nuclease inhibitor protein Gam